MAKNGIHISPVLDLHPPPPLAHGLGLGLGLGCGVLVGMSALRVWGEGWGKTSGALAVALEAFLGGWGTGGFPPFWGLGGGLAPCVCGGGVSKQEEEIEEREESVEEESVEDSEEGSVASSVEHSPRSCFLFIWGCLARAVGFGSGFGLGTKGGGG